MVAGQQVTKDNDNSITADVNGGDSEGQGCINNSQKDTENSQEASAGGLLLEKHQDPVEQTFSSQGEQDGGDGDEHGKYEEIFSTTPGAVSHSRDSIETVNSVEIHARIRSSMSVSSCSRLQWPFSVKKLTFKKQREVKFPKLLHSEGQVIKCRKKI